MKTPRPSVLATSSILVFPALIWGSLRAADQNSELLSIVKRESKGAGEISEEQ